MGKILLVIGLLGLCHAAYSATQHRIYLRLTEQEFSALPKDIILQTVISLFICAFSILNIVGKFKQIKIASEWETKSWDNIGNRTSFYSFNHRGKYLFSDTIPVQEQNQQSIGEQQGEEEEEVEQFVRRRVVTNKIAKASEYGQQVREGESEEDNEEEEEGEEYSGNEESIEEIEEVHNYQREYTIKND